MFFEPVAKLVFSIYQGLFIKNTPDLAVIDLIITMSLHIKEADISWYYCFGSDAFAIVDDTVAGICQRLQQDSASSLKGRATSFIANPVVSALVYSFCGDNLLSLEYIADSLLKLLPEILRFNAFGFHVVRLLF